VQCGASGNHYVLM